MCVNTHLKLYISNKCISQGHMIISPPYKFLKELMLSPFGCSADQTSPRFCCMTHSSRWCTHSCGGSRMAIDPWCAGSVFPSENCVEQQDL